MGDRLATVDMGRKKIGGGSAPFGTGSSVPMQHNATWAEAYLRTKWHLDPSSRLATRDMGRKLGGSALFWGGGTGSPSNTMSLGSRPTSIPSGVL